MSVDPSRLLLLQAIHECGSITHTAHHLGRTPPAVSQQLARLEAEVGAPLVHRHPHGAQLTELGARLATHAENIADALRQADEDIARHHGEHHHRLRLGSFPSAGLALLPEALAALRHRHPAAELSVVDLGPTEGIGLVQTDELDVALVGEYSEAVEAPGILELVPLLDDPIFAVVPTGHPVSDTPAHQPARLADFADDDWACAPLDMPNRRQLEEAARTQGLTTHVPFESESYAVAQAIVSAGVAVTFVPRLALDDTPGTTYRPLAGPRLTRRIHAAVSRTGRAPLVPLFLQLLHSTCTSHASR